MVAGAVVVDAGAVVVVVVSAAVVVGTVVVVVVVVEVVVVELDVVEVSVVVVASTEVVVVTGGAYDQTYCGPGFPLRHASQSVHVGQYPAAASASGCSISQRSVSDARQVKVRAWALPGHRSAADTVAAGITHRVFTADAAREQVRWAVPQFRRRSIPARLFRLFQRHETSRKAVQTWLSLSVPKDGNGPGVGDSPADGQNVKPVSRIRGEMNTTCRERFYACIGVVNLSSPVASC